MFIECIHSYQHGIKPAYINGTTGQSNFQQIILSKRSRTFWPCWLNGLSAKWMTCWKQWRRTYKSSMSWSKFSSLGACSNWISISDNWLESEDVPLRWVYFRSFSKWLGKSPAIVKTAMMIKIELVTFTPGANFFLSMLLAQIEPNLEFLIKTKTENEEELWKVLRLNTGFLLAVKLSNQNQWKILTGVRLSVSEWNKNGGKILISYNCMFYFFDVTSYFTERQYYGRARKDKFAYQILVG